MKYFYFSSSRVFIDAADEIHAVLGVQPCVWFTSPDNVPLLVNRFENTVVVNAFDLICADISTLEKIACPIVYDCLAPKAISEDIEARYIVQENLLHRSDRGRTWSHDEISATVDNYFVIAYSLLSHYRPDTLVFQSPPHTMYDLALYFCAKKRSIDTVLFDMSHIDGISFACTDFLNRGETAIANQILEHGCIEPISAAIAPFFSRNITIEPFYMSTVSIVPPYDQFLGELRNVFLALIALVRRIAVISIASVLNAPVRRVPRNSYEKKPNKNLWESAGGLLSRLTHSISNLSLFAYYKSVSANCQQIQALASGGAKIIYVPLSLQIEYSSMPCAEHMYQQIRLVRMLNVNMPPGYVIVVKEHPRQLSYATGIPRRSKSFYDSLLAMGVVIADLDSPSSVLLSSAAVVACTTGTSAFEASINFRKPTFLFSETPYPVPLPGSFRILSSESLVHAFSRISDPECLISDRQVNHYYEHFRRHSLYLWPEDLDESRSSIGRCGRMEIMSKSVASVILAFL